MVQMLTVNQMEWRPCVCVNLAGPTTQGTYLLVVWVSGQFMNIDACPPTATVMISQRDILLF